MQQGTGHPNELPARDLGPIKARLRRWYVEIPDLYATAEFGIAFICREVGKWAPPLLSPGTFWGAQIPYCGLVFEILYGWLDGQKYVLFSQVIRLLPTDLSPWHGSSSQIAIRPSQIGPFFDLGLFVFIPHNRILNYRGNNGPGRRAAIRFGVSGSVNASNIRLENWSGLPDMLAKIAALTGTMFDIVLVASEPAKENCSSVAFSRGRIWRLFLPQHVPRRRPDISVFSRQPSQRSSDMENPHAFSHTKIIWPQSLYLAASFTNDRFTNADHEVAFGNDGGDIAAGGRQTTAWQGNDDVAIDAGAAFNGPEIIDTIATRTASLDTSMSAGATWLH
ncbi:hypothetical protein MUU53_12005 [Rhizobium lemnae]|uniref:Uncharacterized protein n=1 Tax=Rhizobium lemnae TaxID=1214924 RepID=A0ABV8EG19_9HYPH|nr:hypothetical protein [Rhizobium lemnae]MCJ8508636.1 hypothetical protein [Rhizobium lemnae]